MESPMEMSEPVGGHIVPEQLNYRFKIMQAQSINSRE